jgi:Cytidylate kinase-like family
MASVTISASYGARGERIAKAVAARLGLTFLDRAIPLEVARQLQLSQESAESIDERAPTRGERFVTALAAAGSVSTAPGVSQLPIQDPDVFRAATEGILTNVADTTGAVILGRAAMVVLGGRDDVLCVRLDGPVDARVAQAVADGADAATARDSQRDVDGARSQYANFFYRQRQDDPRLYHLISDSTALPVESCVDLIVRAAEARIGSRAASTTPPAVSDDQ